jgi:hypothetical protein
MSEVQKKTLGIAKQTRPSARERTASLSMQLPPKVLRAITKLSYLQGQSRADVVRAALVEHLQARGVL